MRQLKICTSIESFRSGADPDQAHEAIEAHRNIKILLDELAAFQTYDHTWVPKFQELRRLVESHVAAEENDMFRKTEAIMTAQEAEELGVKVNTAKQAISRDAPTTKGGTQSIEVVPAKRIYLSRPTKCY